MQVLLVCCLDFAPWREADTQVVLLEDVTKLGDVAAGYVKDSWAAARVVCGERTRALRELRD
jgi:hypothetical protein